MAVSMTAADLQRQTGMSEKDAEAIGRVVRMSIDEFQSEVRGKIQGVAIQLVDKLQNELERLTPMQKAIALGIMLDKANAQPKSISQALHIHLKGGDAGSVMKALFGPAADSISSDARSKVNNETNPIEVVATPSQYTGPTALDATARDVESRAKKQ